MRGYSLASHWLGDMRLADSLSAVPVRNYCLNTTQMEKLVEETRADKERIDRLSRCLDFFASVIKSGEVWSDVCQTEYDQVRGE